MSHVFIAVCLLILLSFSSVAKARVYAPRVVSPHNADAYSLKTFAQFHRWRDLRGDALAWEVYRYLCDTRTGVFHMNEVLEGNDTMSEYRTVRDPIKLLNVYGYGYCGIFGPFMAGVCEGIGLGPARMLTLPLWNHVATEVFYDDAWHYLDVDVRAVFLRSDGSLASMEDARRDDSLWRERGPLFFPNDPLGKAREVYRQTEVQHYYGFHQGGHTMDFVLRQGETFTRWWHPQGGRWQHAEVYHETPWLRNLIEQEPRGPKPNHRHFTIHNHGNGRFVYAPDLSCRSTDFQDGVYDARGIVQREDGLHSDGAEGAYVVFEVRTPYIIVPRVGKLEEREDDSEASLLDLEGEQIAVEISLDNGMTWQPLSTVSGSRHLDLTRWVSGTYGYLLRLRFLSGDARIRGMRITTWVQVAPASLPSLRRGVNRMSFRTGDHYGLNTQVVEIRPDANDREAFARHCVLSPLDHDPARKTARIRGEFIVRVPAPPHRRIVWLSIGGSFRTYQLDAALRTHNEIAYAVGSPEHFRTVYRSRMPTDTQHWHTNADVEVRLPEPAEQVFVRYFGEPAVNVVRIYAHCLDERERPESPVQITHAWEEEGRLRTHEVELDSPGEYEITADAEPQDLWIEMRVPSVRTP